MTYPAIDEEGSGSMSDTSKVYVNGLDDVIVFPLTSSVSIVKEVCDYVTGICEEDGFADAVYKHVLDQ